MKTFALALLALVAIAAAAPEVQMHISTFVPDHK